MTAAAAFWDKIAPKYAQDPIKDMQAYEYTLGRTLSYLTSEDRVLELGCGTGNTAVQIAPHVRTIIGTDISPAMVNIARGRDNPTRNAEFRTATAKQAANFAENFDAVLAFNLFHLVDHFEDVIADVHRMLPTGGYLISKTPCLADPVVGFKRHLFRVMIPVMQAFGKAPDVRFFTQKELEDALGFAGFDIVESGNFPAISRYVVARKR